MKRNKRPHKSIPLEIKKLVRHYENPAVLYNGGYESHEDPADYLRSVPKGVRLG